MVFQNASQTTHAPHSPDAQGGSAQRTYTRHRPEESVLYNVIRQELEAFLARAQAREQPVPRFVEQEFHAFLRCGILAHGFLRLRCDDCGFDRLVPFSCKRRGFCPSCGGHRMADTAAHLVDRVLPEVPIRQWVLTLPYPLRYRCAYDARLTSEVLRAFLRSLFAELRRRARRHRKMRAPQCGAVSFIQRFGSALNLNLHFHTLALDGVYADDASPGEAPRFLPLPPPDDDAVARVLAGTARRLERIVAKRAAEDEDALARDEPLLAVLAAASLRGHSASGPNAGERWRRLGDRVEPPTGNDELEASPRIPQHGGLSLHAAVAVPARDRQRLERLCRYVARPPLANERLEEHPDGRLALRLKTRWRDGTSHILMERSELIDRLVPLIPPPRAHQVRYHGILAPCASRRDRVVPAGVAAVAIAGHRPGTAPVRSIEPSASTDPRSVPTALDGANIEVENADARTERRPTPPVAAAPEVDLRGFSPNRATRRRYRWAELLQRVFEIDALLCPRCGSTLHLIAAIEDPAVARRILECLNLPARSPPVEPASWAAIHPKPVAPNRDADWEFDQSRPAREDSNFS
ncbi:MAG: transposase [Planctomycetota bacterium]